MNMFRKGTLALCALLSLSFAVPAQQAKAEGFATPLESSARGMALGGGLVARGGDPSVIAFNPAAMTRLEGTQIQGNLAITQMYWGVDMDNLQTKKRENYHSAHQTWPIPSWYLTHQMNDKLWLGIGQHIRFGLGVKYPNNWPGGANLQSVQLITSSITPNIAYKLTDKTLIRLGQGIMLLGVMVMLLPLGTTAAMTGLLLIGLGCAPIYPCVIHSTPGLFGEENSQAIIGVQMASAYVGICCMPPLFGILANHIGVFLLPWYTGAILVLMVVMCEQLNRRCMH